MLDPRREGAQVYAFLDQGTTFDVQRCGDAAHEIQAGLPVREAMRLPLTRYAGPWLLSLVAALLKFDEERASRTEAVAVAEVTGLLRATR
ncbi:hypothetical protein OK006_3008 [Actinobacteria bacterium OK006]|nr:hypothetical protein OK006_3008 [Actinobacteria bacterium OK006]